MKRFLLTVVSFSLLFTYANASKCAGAENTMTRCYEVSLITADGRPYGLIPGGYYPPTQTWYTGENIKGYSGRQTGLTWYAMEIKNLYGELHYGIKVEVDSYRTKYKAEEQPVRVTLGSAHGVLLSQRDIIKNGYIIGQTYTYYLRYKTTSQVSTLGDINIKDTIQIWAPTGTGLGVHDTVNVN